MYGRGGGGRRGDRGPYRRFQRHGNQGPSRDDYNQPQEYYDRGSYDYKRQRVNDNYSYQSQKDNFSRSRGSYDSEAGPSRSNRPPPHLKGKEIEFTGGRTRAFDTTQQGNYCHDIPQKALWSSSMTQDRYDRFDRSVPQHCNYDVPSYMFQDSSKYEDMGKYAEWERYVTSKSNYDNESDISPPNAGKCSSFFPENKCQDRGDLYPFFNDDDNFNESGQDIPKIKNNKKGKYFRVFVSGLPMDYPQKFVAKLIRAKGFCVFSVKKNKKMSTFMVELMKTVDASEILQITCLLGFPCRIIDHKEFTRLKNGINDFQTIRQRLLVDDVIDEEYYSDDENPYTDDDNDAEHEYGGVLNDAVQPSPKARQRIFRVYITDLPINALKSHLFIELNSLGFDICSIKTIDSMSMFKVNVRNKFDVKEFHKVTEINGYKCKILTLSKYLRSFHKGGIHPSSDIKEKSGSQVPMENSKCENGHKEGFDSKCDDKTLKRAKFKKTQGFYISDLPMNLSSQDLMKEIKELGFPVKDIRKKMRLKLYQVLFPEAIYAVGMERISCLMGKKCRVIDREEYGSRLYRIREQKNLLIDD